MDDRTIARWRLRAQGLVGPGHPGVADAVSALVGVQAENLAQASWAVAERTAGVVTEQDVLRLLDDGAVLRTHVLRPTWHFVTPSDLPWLVDLTAPRVRRTYEQVREATGLTGAEVARGRDAVLAALEQEGALAREELRDRVAAAGVDATGQRLGVVLGDLELDALICSGPSKGGDQTWALVAERAPGGRRLGHEEALAELALRYFAGHGPATERDLAYWASLTLTQVRAGLAAVRHGLDSFEHEGRTYWFAEPPSDDAATGAADEPRGHLLQVLDEYHHGYQDSRYHLDAEGLVPRGRPADVGMALVDGQMLGGMVRRRTTAGVTFTVGTFRPLRGDERAALAGAADRYGRFLGLEPTLDARPCS